MALIRIDPSSEEYRQFVRLYEAARALRPSEVDRWNRELYATIDEGQNWGSFHPDGYFKLSKELVFDKLGPDATPQEQVQALATVLHESNHARVQVNAQNEPNAVLSRHSKALDEGLTEWVSVNDVAAFADMTGYGELPDAKPEYPAAYQATESLLEYAAGPEGASELADRAVDAPVVMRWDVIADEIVKNRLGDVVPPDPQHEQAARAELVNAMTQRGWAELDRSQPDVGPVVARDTTEALDQATQRIREHYAGSPGTPYPAKTPNFLVAQQEAQQNLGGSQDRIVSRGGHVDLTKLPPPNAASRVDRPEQTVGTGSRQGDARSDSVAPQSGRTTGDFARSARATPSPQGGEVRFLSGSPSAAQAIRRRPDLGNGARGAGAPDGAGINRPGISRDTTPPDRAR